jgi:hypothetical protein
VKEIADSPSAPPTIPEAARRAALSAPTPSIQLAHRLAELLGIGQPAEMSAVSKKRGAVTPLAPIVREMTGAAG